jgi:hypothetical protein
MLAFRINIKMGNSVFFFQYGKKWAGSTHGIRAVIGDTAPGGGRACEKKRMSASLQRGVCTATQG